MTYAKQITDKEMSVCLLNNAFGINQNNCNPDVEAPVTIFWCIQRVPSICNDKIGFGCIEVDMGHIYGDALFLSATSPSVARENPGNQNSLTTRLFNRFNYRGHDLVS